MRHRLLRVLGVVIGDVDPAVLPILPITFIYYVSFSTFWVYVGVFAIKGLGWRPSEVGVLFLACAPPAAVANYLSGRISDVVGRKRPIIFSFFAASATTVGLSLFGHHRPIAFGLIVALGVVGAPAFSLDRVLVADLVTDQRRREAGYSAVRVATNLASFAGPPLGALLITFGGWGSLLVAIAALGIVGAAVTAAVLPARTTSPATPHQGGIRLVLVDRAFRLLLLSTLLGYVVYCGFETVLPVVAVSNYGLAPATWGPLVIIGPLLVVILQLRLIAAAARLSQARRLATSMLLMGLPFLALLVDAGVAVIACVIVVFVLGEMVWMPTLQASAARLAPTCVRGSYLGALAAMTGPAWTLTPFIALTLRSRVGVGSIWLLLAGAAVSGATAGIAALHAAQAVLCSPPPNHNPRASPA